MIIRKAAAIYAIIIGFSMIGFWIMYLTTGQVPEFETKPYEITFHLVTEFLTAALLLIGGLGLFANRLWGFKLHLLSLGLLLYSAISEGLGFFVEKGEMPMIVMFSIITVLTLIFIALNLKSEEFKSR